MVHALDVMVVDRLAYI